MFSIIPLPYKLLALFLMLVSLFSAGWFERGQHEKAKQRDQALAYAEAIKKEQARGDEIEKQLTLEKTRQKIIYRNITKEVPRYVSTLSDSRCVVPVGFVLLHNAAAEARLSETASKFADSPSGIALSTVAETVTDNYATCNEIRAQLNALIDWETGR